MERKIITIKRNSLKRSSPLKNIFVNVTTFKAITFIVIFGFLIYGNSLYNGFIGDDTPLILSNQFVHSLTYIPQLFSGGTFYTGTNHLTGLYYRPLISVLYAILYFLFGSNAFAFYFFQLLIHIINSVLVFLIFRYFFKNGVSFILSLFFLVHPMNSETVAYIAALDDIVFFFFGILALYVQLTMKESNKKIIGVGILLLFSLFSKESAVLFIAIVVLYQLIFHAKYLVKTLVSLSVVILIYGYFLIFIDNATNILNSLGYFISSTDSLRVAVAPTVVPITQLAFDKRIFSVPATILYYLQTVFWPMHLSIVHVWIVTSLSSPGFYLDLIIDLIIVLFTLVFGMYLYKKRTQYFKTLLFFTLWLWLGLLFYSQLFFSLDFTVSDNWFYFPLVGLLGTLGFLIEFYVKKNITFYRVFCVITSRLSHFSVPEINCG